MIKIIKNILRPYKIKLKMLKAYFIRKKNKDINHNFKCNKDTKRCFNNKYSPNYMYEYFGDNTPICCATNLYKILKDVTKVLERHNLEYFISFGTLLGAVRHGGLIPWDTDTDIIIPHSQKEKYFDVLKKELTQYDIKDTKEKDVVGSVIRVYLSKVNTLHVDLFTFLEDNEKIIFGFDRKFDKKEIYPLQKIPFYDSKLFAPKNIDKHLKNLYGKDYMEYAYKQWALDKSKFKIDNYSPAKIEIK